MLTYPWKVNGRLCSRATARSGSCHTARAQRHYLGKWCNAEGLASIVQCGKEKIKIKEQHEEEVAVKAGKHEPDVALDSKRKRGGGNQQKMNCTLSHQDK